MREICLDEVKAMQIDILRCIDEFCTVNNITYSLAYGTLIGAVRHKGYIPWDDDIDIIMLRDDYNRFVKSFNGSFKHLSLLSPEINTDYYAPYANVYDNRTVLLEGCNDHRGFGVGVKIDIFPIDNVPMKFKRYKYILNKINLINSIMYKKRLKNIYRNKFVLKEIVKIYICKICFFVVPYSYLQNLIMKISATFSNIETNYVDNIVYNPYYKKYARFEKNLMCDIINIPFEGYNFKVVKDYDIILRNIYGDYLLLPPKDQQVPHHNFKAFWKD